MIVFGFGKRTTKDRGVGTLYNCPRCHNNVRFKLIEQKVWFTLFFIPVIPYKTAYLELCPICSYGGEVPKDAFDAAIASAAADNAYITS